ncbi:SDR family oxidoreductase [Shewanella eurypsychrophilus]|uniref:SDR family oxidoreductase n=1 Tax=Shewanella eurypsychrophilus TaxID=2593656 RepID=A0ABX6V7A2_9GAMM|nr:MULTISPECIES: SDR family oxidoreductase [Shewanella]QFU23293.1 SDR family NAD(P)-dependent oxidoreductase [Shewanella sp. YLB-09]QPG58522.1 SDR family oxidoreductase [Shewanella eurypsychrophilus]
MKISTVSIVGCGWFGFPLAKHLVKLGYEVSGSKRQGEAANTLQVDGINGFSLDLDNQQFNEESVDIESLELLDFEAKANLIVALHTDAIVINIPPSLRKHPDAYLKRLGFLKSLMDDHLYQRVIFISTTGVYPATGESMTESDASPHSPSSEILLQAESLFSKDYPTSVLRFSGLIGPARHPGRFLAGKKDLSGPDAAVNLVHLDDCIGAVSCLLSSETISPVYNLCASGHPSRAEFYTQAAEHLSLEAPSFGTEPQVEKIIDGSKITKELGFHYRHDSPLDMLDKC